VIFPAVMPRASDWLRPVVSPACPRRVRLGSFHFRQYADANEIASLLIITKLEQIRLRRRYRDRTMMLAASFVLLFAINALQ
jgi:hypothetical protein